MILGYDRGTWEVPLLFCQKFRDWMVEEIWKEKTKIVSINKKIKIFCEINTIFVMNTQINTKNFV